MHYDKQPKQSAARSLAVAQVSAKYQFLASWSNACGWKRATFRFTVSLAWAEIYRTNMSRVVFDARDGYDEDTWNGWR